MSRRSTTFLECNYKKCGKIFSIPDPPEQPTEGVEDVLELGMVVNGQLIRYHFCNMLHLIAFGTEYVRSSPIPESKVPLPKKLGISESQFETLKTMGIIVDAAPAPESRAHAAVEELETLLPNIPPIPDDLRLD